MFFYDWETNVLGDDGKPDPTNAAVTGDGQAGSGRRGALAVRRR